VEAARGGAYLRGVAETRPIQPSAFDRLDDNPDETFYSVPRFVQHIDEGAIAAVTDLYRQLFPAGASILDLCSSWVSHLPPETCYGRVVGIGMNAHELAENPFLDEWHVQNLNDEPHLPFADEEFDGAAICVSVQYLTRPIELLRDVGRVLRVGAPLEVAFSDRCFPTKAIACWRMLDDEGHLHLVGHYLAEAGNWRNARCFHHCPCTGDPLHAVIAYSTGASK
jgi:SAM-dependent methyltransferase